MDEPDPHTHRKRFGQHFLVDDFVIDRIVDCVAPAPGDHVLEIGPGDAALTAPLLASGCELCVVEIDRDLAKRLTQRFDAHANFTLYCADILKFDFGMLAARAASWKVVGNLPYNISTPLIMRLLAYGTLWSSATLMVQREVAERLAAPPGGGNYGRLSIATQRRCTVNLRLNIGPASFDPPPRVDSTIVELTPFETSPDPAAEAWLSEVVRVAFSARRKTVANALRRYVDEATLRACGIDPGARAAELSVDDYARLAAASRP